LLTVAKRRVEYPDPCSFHAQSLLTGTSRMLRGMGSVANIIII
jgi:hypothetical protein